MRLCAVALCVMLLVTGLTAFAQPQTMTLEQASVQPWNATSVSSRRRTFMTLREAAHWRRMDATYRR